MPVNYRFLFSFCLILTLLSATFSQTVSPTRVVPLEMATMRYEDTYIKITYSSPITDENKVFGNEVPYKKLWAPGANEMTEIMLTREILIQNDTLPSGAYSIFVIPDQNEWTVIFNSRTELWGTYQYDEKHDVLSKVLLPSKSENFYERFTITFRDRGLQKTFIDLNWGFTQISIPIEFLNPYKEE